MSVRPKQYGLLAEFSDPAALLECARQARAAGYQRLDAFTPFPVEGLAEELGHRRTALPLIVLAGGIIGCVGGYFMQYWMAAIDYPLNIGGRPLNSWPMFVPVTFELTVLIASLFALLGMLGLNGLPRPHHPLFNVPEFALATRDRFFLCIEAADPRFESNQTREFLAAHGARAVMEVPF
jgi:hypothetical protein